MPFEAWLIGLAVLASALALTPVGRRLLATAVDVVDGSIAAAVVRRALDLDPGTARQRRIDRRRARERAELLRRIGAAEESPAAARVPAPVAPTRLVVSGHQSGDHPGHDARDVGASGPRRAAPTDPRGRLLRDGAVAAAGMAVVVLLVSTLDDRPAGGVLGATGSPLTTATVAQAPGRSGSPGPSGWSGPVTPSPVAATPVATMVAPIGVGPVVMSPRFRLIGTTAGGATVGVRLSWAMAPGSVPPAAFEVGRSVAAEAIEPITTLAGDARDVDVTLEVARATVFRIRAIGHDGSAGDPIEWAPITAGRHQESSELIELDGTWRGAEGPSLSGGAVRFTRDSSASLTFSFRGTDVGWVATRTPSSGRAEVRVDGDLVAVVDLVAAAVRYRELVFRGHVAGDGTHVLEIRPIGDGRVDVDAFIVLR